MSLVLYDYVRIWRMRYSSKTEKREWHFLTALEESSDYGSAFPKAAKTLPRLSNLASHLSPPLTTWYFHDFPFKYSVSVFYLRWSFANSPQLSLYLQTLSLHLSDETSQILRWSVSGTYLKALSSLSDYSQLGASSSDTNGSSANSTSASPTTIAQKRKAARDAVNERAPRKKPMRKKKNKTGSADKGQLSLDAVARKTRWMVLLDFSRKAYESVIKSVYGDDVSPESAEYNAARSQIFDQVRQYKSLTLATMKAS